jgi:hypothetical protein
MGPFIQGPCIQGPNPPEKNVFAKVNAANPASREKPA